MKTTFNLALVAVLAAVLGASPADAQGNGKKSRDSDRDRHEQRDRDRDDDDDRPRFERRDDGRASQQRRVPPGWCRGQGNPHNTRENCRYNDRYSRWERYDSRSGRYETRDVYDRNRNDRNRNVSGTRGSYDQSHREFHYSHDRQCRDRAAQRPLDPRWQIQVRADCKATHDDFHRRWGIAHR